MHRKKLYFPFILALVIGLLISLGAAGIFAGCHEADDATDDDHHGYETLVDDDQGDDDDSADVLPAECGPLEGDPAAWLLAPRDEWFYPTRVIRHPANGDAEELDPARLAAGGEQIPLAGGWLELDFGLDVTGRLELGVRDAAGLQTSARFAEDVRYLTDTALQPYELLTALSMPFVWLPGYHRHLFNGDADYLDPLPVGAFRHVRLQIEAGSGRLDYARVKYNAYRTTETELAGYFLCDDERLNRIWYAGLQTLDLCTIPADQGTVRSNRTVGDGPWALVDGGRRDRLIWTADLYVADRVLFLTRDDWSAAFDSLAYLGEHQRADGNVPACSPVGTVGLNAYRFLEYTLFYALAAWDEYFYTGDPQRLAVLYPRVKRALAYAETQADGDLLDLTSQTGLGWCWTIERRGHVTFTNILFYQALRLATAMAELSGRPNEAADFLARAETVRAAVDAMAWDDGRGIYVESDTDAVHVPLDANALAILTGMASGRAGRILAYWQSNMNSPYGLVNVDPAYDGAQYNLGIHNRRSIGFVNYFAAEAMFLAGHDAEAFTLLARCFGHMATTDPASTLWEFIGPDGRPEMSYISQAHAWSAGATTLLTQYVLGVKPLAPGYERLSIAPHLHDLLHVEGRVPTPFGSVDVRWQRAASSGELWAYLTIPAGVEAELTVPSGYGEWRSYGSPPSRINDRKLRLNPGNYCLNFSSKKGDGRR